MGRAPRPLLARLRPLRRHPRHPLRQLPRDVDLSRVGHQRLQPQPAVRPVHDRAAGRRPVCDHGRRHARADPRQPDRQRLQPLQHHDERGGRDRRGIPRALHPRPHRDDVRRSGWGSRPAAPSATTTSSIRSRRRSSTSWRRSSTTRRRRRWTATSRTRRRSCRCRGRTTGRGSPRWSRRSADAKAAVEARRKAARPEFEAWIAGGHAGGRGRRGRRTRRSLDMPFAKGRGRTTRVSLVGKESDLPLTATTAWQAGPSGAGRPAPRRRGGRSCRARAISSTTSRSASPFWVGPAGGRRRLRRRRPDGRQPRPTAAGTSGCRAGRVAHAPRPRLARATRSRSSPQEPAQARPLDAS